MSTNGAPHGRPLRVAVLECDTPLDGTRAKYGGYGGVFKALLLAAAASASASSDLASALGAPPGYGLDITKWDVETAETYPEPENVDAILITGSRNNAFDSKPWILKLVAYVQRVLHLNSDGSPSSSTTANGNSASSTPPRVKVIGVCFGHQIVGRALGTPCERSDKGWEASVLPLELTEKGREIFGRDNLSLHQMHRDIVPRLPSFSPSSPTSSTPDSSSERSTPEITLLARSPLCDIQGFYAPHRLLTVQGHPEFNQTIVEELLESRHKQGIFNDGMFEDAMRRVGDQQDGVVVGRAFLRFALEGRGLRE